MTFTWKGRTWDTDKDVFVGGYVISKTWFPLVIEEIQDNQSFIEERGLKIKKGNIAKIVFGKVDGANTIMDVFVDIPAYYYSPVSIKTKISGKGAQEVKAIYKTEVNKSLKKTY